jgi:uncharacterized protein (DUF362 family)
VQNPSTHVDILSATVDAVLAHGARQVTVAEGATDASAGFTRFGYRRETWGLPVRFFDINREECDWEPLVLAKVDGSLLRARVSKTVADSSCRISLALAKTHGTSIVSFAMKNMLSSIHPADRVMMHGYEGGGNGYAGWKRMLVEVLKQDTVLIKGTTRLLGRLKRIGSGVTGKAGPGGWRRLSPGDVRFLRSVDAMNHNLVALMARVRPHVSVVDGFVAMHREGPRHGTPIRLGTVIAGTDAVAVDAVAAAIMGFPPQQIGYLQYAHEAGLGVADLDAITIVGDPIATVRRRCVPHSNYAVQRHWSRLGELTGGSAAATGVARPHVRTSRIQEVNQR